MASWEGSVASFTDRQSAFSIKPMISDLTGYREKSKKRSKNKIDKGVFR